jgi:hypothetical protein
MLDLLKERRSICRKHCLSASSLESGRSTAFNAEYAENCLRRRRDDGECCRKRWRRQSAVVVLTIRIKV